MKFSISVSVKGGPRTPVEVDVYTSSVNVKEIRFANGAHITDEAIAKWIKTGLEEALKKFAGEVNNGKDDNETC